MLPPVLGKQIQSAEFESFGGGKSGKVHVTKGKKIEEGVPSRVAGGDRYCVIRN